MKVRPYQFTVDTESSTNRQDANGTANSQTKELGNMKPISSNSAPDTHAPAAQVYDPWTHGFFYMVVHATFVAASISVGAAVRATMHQIIIYQGNDDDIINTWRYVGGTWMTSVAMFCFSFSIVYVYQLWTIHRKSLHNRCINDHVYHGVYSADATNNV
jgi:hypothetical protein